MVGSDLLGVGWGNKKRTRDPATGRFAEKRRPPDEGKRTKPMRDDDAWPTRSADREINPAQPAVAYRIVPAAKIDLNDILTAVFSD